MGLGFFRICFGCMPQRYVMGLLALCGFAMSYILRNCLSMAILDMVPDKGTSSNTTNTSNANDICPNIEELKHVHSTKGDGPTYDWTEAQQSNLLGAFYYGYLISHIPGGLTADYFGGKHVFGGGVLISALISLLSPLSASIHYYLLWATRFLMGLAQGILYPAANVLLARWIPPQERGVMGSVVLAATQIGNVICNTLSGFIMSGLSWPWVFYIWGVCGIVWYMIFFVSVYSDPSSHPFIKEEEKSFLSEALSGVTARKDIPRLPICSILTSIPVWALILCQFGHDYGLFGIQSYYPKYLKTVLKFQAAKNGVVASIPYLGMWIVALVGGYLADWTIRKEYLSRANSRRVFGLISQVCPGFGCILAIYVGCDRIASITVTAIGMSIMGLFFPSVKVNAIDLSPNYSGFLMAISNGIGAASGFVTTLVFGWLMKDNPTLGDWKIFFWLSNAVISLTGVFYVIFMSADIQKWNNPNENSPE